MAKKKISELPAGSALNGSEIVPIVQTGTTKRVTAQDIANLGNASGVEGSGTINYLSKFTASSTIGNSQLFDNGTAIGIGTITPLGLLHLFKASATTRMVMDGNASQSKIITYRTNGVQRFGLYLNNTPESGSNVGSDFQIRAYSDAGTLLSTPILIKRSTGLVTIGGELKVSTADANLNLQGTSKSYVLQVVDSNNKFRIFDNTANVERFSIATGGAANFSSSVTAADDIISTNGTITSVLAYSGTYGGVIGTISNHNANIYTNGTPKLTITSAGSVGIGTTSPSYKFQTAASVNSDWVGSFYNTSTISPNGLQVRVGVSSSAQALGVYTDGIGYTFNVLGNGNTLIGTTTDAGYKLDVNGTARVSGQLTIGSNIILSDSQDISWGTGGYGAYKPTISATDGVGIKFYPDGQGSGNTFTINTNGTATFSSSIQATQGKFYGARPQGIFTENNTGGLYLRDATSTSYKSWSIGTNDIVLGFAITASTTNGGSTFTTPLFIVKESGTINMSSLPTSSAGLSAGDIWNDSGTLKIV